MGLFNQNCCIDCGKPIKMLMNYRLADDQYICMDCFNKLAVPMRTLFDVTMESWLTSESYKAYMDHKKKMERYWNQLRDSDKDLMGKIDKIMDNFYVCDTYGFYVVGPIPEDGSYSNDFDIYHVKDTRYEEFKCEPGKNDKCKNIISLEVMLRNPGVLFSYMMDKNAYSMEIGQRYKFDFYDRYNYKTAISGDAEICSARVGRMRIMSKMEQLRENPENARNYDRDYERALGLFMLTEKDSYGVAYLDQVRDTLTKVHGIKAEIEQAYDILLKHMGDGSGENHTEQNISRFCPHCGSENPDGARFCENCGKELI